MSISSPAYCTAVIQLLDLMKRTTHTKKTEQTLMALCCHKVFYEGATFVPHHKTVNCVNWTGPAVSPPQPAGLRSVKSSVI